MPWSCAQYNKVSFLIIKSSMGSIHGQTTTARNGFLVSKETVVACCVSGRDENKNLVLSNELGKG